MFALLELNQTERLSKGFNSSVSCILNFEISFLVIVLYKEKILC